jgi:hypothetical protein
MCFLVEPQNQDRHVSDLASKSLGRFVNGLASKSLGRFSGLASKPMAMVSPGLSSKLVVEGFLVCASKLAATLW